MNRYNQPVTISTIFFDLDDTLYPASSGLWAHIKDRIGLFMLERLNIPASEMQALRRKYFEEYGTTLRGLQANFIFDVPDFLAYVHDVPLAEYIHPDPVLQSVLESLPARKYIFTNADVHHAERVLRVLQIEQYFDGIIDVTQLGPYCKPMPQAFKIALQLAGESDPQKCVMIDDLPRTIRAARDEGMLAILFGTELPNPDADAALADWSKLPAIINGR
ncbi:MAG: pyrimidine 5'-nucleotidase [Chloroflexi bacterium]|nr:pyrimidine 5'-nucleotidase [Chloroflexota bacterium]